MPFLLLLILSVACLPVRWPAPAYTTLTGNLILTRLAVAAWVGVAAVLAHWTRRQLEKDPGRREAVLQRYGACRLYHWFSLFAVYGLTLYALGWGWAVQTVCTREETGQLLFGAEVFILAPF